jgi:hypothetical protein
VREITEILSCEVGDSFPATVAYEALRLARQLPLRFNIPSPTLFSSPIVS